MSGRAADHWQALLLVGLVSAAPYLATATAGFVWDDKTHVIDNPAIRSFRPLHAFTVRYWEHEFAWPGLYRPMYALTLAADFALWGQRAGGYHVTSLLLHALASIAVCWLVATWTGRWPVAVVAGLAFGVLPCHVEAVAWVKNRNEVLTGLCSALSVACFWRAVRGRLHLGWWLAALAAFACALCSKPSAVVVPALAAAVVLLGLRGRARWSGLVWTLPMWLGAGAFMTFRLAMFSSATFANLRGAPDMSVLQQLSIVADTFLFYVRMLLAPLHMAPLHGLELLPSVAWAESSRLALAALLGAGLVWAAWRSRHRAWVVWLAVGLAPLVNLKIIACRPLAEQRLYLASIGLCAWGAGALVRRGRSSWLAALALVPLAALSVHQVGHWRSDSTLWRQAMRVSPGVARVQEWRGLSVLEYGRKRLAEKHLRRATELDPTLAAPWDELGKLWSEQRKFADAERAFQAAIAAQGNWSAPHNDLGARYAVMGRWDAAVASFDNALAIQPNDARAATNRARALVRMARERVSQRQIDAALACLSRIDSAQLVAAAVQVEAHTLAAQLLLTKGRGKQALEHINAALRLRPADPALRQLKQRADASD